MFQLISHLHINYECLNTFSLESDFVLQKQNVICVTIQELE